MAFVCADDAFVNAELLKKGYAQVATHPPNIRHQELFLRLQKEAREAGRGLLAGAREERAPSGKIIGNKRSKIYHLPGGAYCDKVSPKNRVYFDTGEEAVKAGYKRSKR